MSSMQTVWATPTGYPVDASTVFQSPLNPPQHCPSRPLPVATPIEFMQIMDKVRAAHEADDSRPIDASWSVRLQSVTRPGLTPTPQAFHEGGMSPHERRIGETHGRDVGLFTPYLGPDAAAVRDSAHVEFSTSLTTVRARSDWGRMNDASSGISPWLQVQRPVAVIAPQRFEPAMTATDTMTINDAVGGADERFVATEHCGTGEATPRRWQDRVKVTEALLLRIEALGASGIAAKGGIGEVAKANGIARSTLKPYISSTGLLSAEGRIRVREGGRFRAGKVTAGLLKALKEMGPNGIQSRGGLQAIAREEGVAFRTLMSLVTMRGEPSTLGRARLDEFDPARRARKRPVTAEILLSIQRLGASGIRAAGGLPALAKRHDVFLSSLRTLINSKAKLGPDGKRVLTGERPSRVARISNDLLRDVKALGRKGIKAAGGLAGLAKANNVKFEALRRYINCRGVLTPAGRVRLYGPDPSHTARVTPSLLREIEALGKDGIASEGGLDALANKRHVAPHTLRQYVTLGGKLRRPGTAMVARYMSDNVSV
ncbi:hypothetical protein [Pandoraea aquatica]|nr:hypothetical protein [Pandoraea aquatica]